jgi:TRAP-type C4-dicarboxylate transport system substrate-binding protein
VREQPHDRVENYQKAGVEFTRLTPEEKRPFADATRKVWDTFRKRVPNGGALLDKVIEAKKTVR